MGGFRRLCSWFGAHRTIAFVLGVVTLGFVWAMAGIGRSRLDEPSLVGNWTLSKHRRPLITATVINILLLGYFTAFFIFFLLNGGFQAIFLILVCLPVLIACFDLAGALKSGRDAFELATAFDHDPPLPVSGRLPSAFVKSFAPLPPKVRSVFTFQWSWCVATAMILSVLTFIALYLFIWFISLIVDFASGGAVRVPRGVVQSRGDNKPREFGYNKKTAVTTDFGGPLSQTVATIVGTEIREGTGIPGCRILATIEGNSIIVSDESGKRVAYTLDGTSIKEGTGGPFAPAVATIEGNQIKAKDGGIFATPLYTLEEAN